MISQQLRANFLRSVGPQRMFLMTICEILRRLYTIFDIFSIFLALLMVFTPLLCVFSAFLFVFRRLTQFLPPSTLILNRKRATLQELLVMHRSRGSGKRVIPEFQEGNSVLTYAWLKSGHRRRRLNSSVSRRITPRHLWN